MNIPELNKRILQLVDIKASGSVNKFSKKINISQQKLNRLFILDKRTQKYPSVPTDIIVNISEMFVNINIDWLMTGRGEMFNNQSNENYSNNNIVTGSGNMQNNNSNNNQLVADDNLFLENAFLKKEVKILREQLEMQKKFIEILEKK